MFEKLREKREQERKQMQAKYEAARKAEKERLMTMSEKELLVELILAVKDSKKDIEDKLDDVKRAVMIYGD